MVRSLLAVLVAVSPLIIKDRHLYLLHKPSKFELQHSLCHMKTLIFSAKILFIFRSSFPYQWSGVNV